MVPKTPPPPPITISGNDPPSAMCSEAIAHLHAIEGEIVRVDLVEFNPGQDVTGVAATVAAKILQEILGKMIQGRV